MSEISPQISDFFVSFSEKFRTLLPTILSPPRSLLFQPPFLTLFIPSSRAHIQQFYTFCFHNLHKILHNSLLNSVLHMY
ncbi:hypothetical protein HMPREF9999_01512 [Alloprevotella sp. oral taxon 473 str. F0040]|nr:hypothetical protein HMPREF9999_01512 [Alloprevotella sp. oral taxon 473 str. F0040]